MFLTWLHTCRSDSVEETVLSHAVWTLNHVDSSHQEKRASSHRVYVKGPFKVLSHTERCVERRDNATNGKNRTFRCFHPESERWRSDACFSWCDEATRSTFHTARDNTVISTLLDLYMCSQVRNISYASDNWRDGFSACSNAPVWIHH